MAKHLIDTALYIDLIQSGTTLPFIREIYDKAAPGIYFSGRSSRIVRWRELWRGESVRKILFRSFERVGRVVTPTHSHWKDARVIIAQVLHVRPDLRNKLPALVNDCLLALSARSLGATLYTRNRADFSILQRQRSFSLLVIH